MAEILPPSPNDPPPERRSGGILNIGQFHYHGSDLAELRKLAEVDPSLASKVVDQRDAEDGRANASYRFGIAASAVLVLGVVAAFAVILIFAGPIESAVVIGGILAVALLIRVILTGEWSDTSWFGKMMVSLAKALGAKSVDLKNGDDS